MTEFADLTKEERQAILNLVKISLPIAILGFIIKWGIILFAIILAGRYFGVI